MDSYPFSLHHCCKFVRSVGQDSADMTSKCTFGMTGVFLLVNERTVYTIGKGKKLKSFIK